MTSVPERKFDLQAIPMTAKARIAAILRLAVPICIGTGSAFIMLFVDLVMIGSLGNAAVAALGLSGFSFALVLAFVMGVLPAVQGLVARSSGEGSTAAGCVALNGGLAVVLTIGIPLTVVCYLLAPLYYSVVTSDPQVVREGVPYLRALFTAIVAVGMNSAFQGYWTGVAKAQVYMLIILAMTSLNIILNCILIFGKFGAPPLGTAGAGIATAVSAWFGCFLYCMVTFRVYRRHGFAAVKPDAAVATRIFRTALPASLRDAFFSLGYVGFYWIVGLVGTAELAAANVLIRITLVLILFADSLGRASATLVARSLGTGDVAGAARYGWDTAKLGVIGITVLGVPLIIFPEWFLSFFLTDPYTLSIAIVPMQLSGLSTGLMSLIYIFAHTLFSLGDGKRVLIVSFATQWIFFLPAVWLIGPYLNYGLLEIWLVQIAYGAMAATMITALWTDNRWQTTRL